MNHHRIKEAWLAKERRARISKKRRYLHFDLPVKYRKKLEQVSNPCWVFNHAFYPLLFDIIKTPRFRKDSNTQNRVIKYKQREIYYASHVDSLVYSWYSTLLSSDYEKYIEIMPFAPSVLAYRELGKNNVHFAKEAFQFVSSLESCCTLAFDITNYFDNLDHQILKEEWRKVLRGNRLRKDHYRVFRSLTKFSFVEKSELTKVLGKKGKGTDSFRICTNDEFRRLVRKGGLIKVNKQKKGIPQGTPISAVLSNIYMIEFDKKVYNYISSLNGEYRRYSDDILIVCPIDKREKVQKFVQEAIGEIKLELNPSKTEITIFRKDLLGQLEGKSLLGTPKNLQYLGLEFDGVRSFIRSSSLSRYYRKMKASVNEAAKRKNGNHRKDRKIWKRKLYSVYTCYGRRNFPSYVYRAADILESKSCRRQIKGHLIKLNKYIDHADQKWAKRKTGKYSFKYINEKDLSPWERDLIRLVRENKLFIR